jgi:hypothetical protein
MGNVLSRIRTRYGDTEGIVLPVIILGLVVMSTLAVAAVMTAGDEQKSSQAMRQASTAFYAAEAGFNQIYAQWATYEAQIDSLEPGDTLDLGWQKLSTGSSYRPLVIRLDNAGGGQPLYALQAEGRGLGALAGMRTLRLLVTSSGSGGGEGYKLGECCEAAVTVRGYARLQDDTGLDGHDMNPPGWDDACTNELHDKAGLTMLDTTKFTADGSTWMDGEPPLAQDNTLSDATWDSLGSLAWQDLAAMAEKTFHDGTWTPRPSTKIEAGELVCDTDDPLNLGSNDPTHPCFDYFPIVLISDNVTFEFGHAQGIFVLNWDEATDQGSEFDLEVDQTLAGLILGKGCVEPENNSRTYGAIFVDANYRNLHLCNSDKDFDMNDGDAELHYSTCAIDRALTLSGLEEYAEPEFPDEEGVTMLVSRSFLEVF